MEQKAAQDHKSSGNNFNFSGVGKARTLYLQALKMSILKRPSSTDHGPILLPVFPYCLAPVVWQPINED